MRYLISKYFSTNVTARQKYIYNTMHLWTKRLPCENDFTTLESIPPCSLDIVFIVGHNVDVEKFLTAHHSSFSESTIVSITCNSKINLSSIKKAQKELYLPHQNKNSMAELLNGEKYGFSFDLTESEIIFYNNEYIGDIFSRLDHAFTKI
jgi:phosphohistidine phosphatase SixA